MTWALWLALPVGATSVAALWSWWRGHRARWAKRTLGTEDAVRAHSEFLDALTIPARSAHRQPRPDVADHATDTLPG